MRKYFGWINSVYRFVDDTNCAKNLRKNEQVRRAIWSNLERLQSTLLSIHLFICWLRRRQPLISLAQVHHFAYICVLSLISSIHMHTYKSICFHTWQGSLQSQVSQPLSSFTTRQSGRHLTGAQRSLHWQATIHPLSSRVLRQRDGQ